MPAVTTDGISAEAEWSSRMCACIERGQLHESDVFGRAAADQVACCGSVYRCSRAVRSWHSASEADKVIFQAPDSCPTAPA